VIKSVSTGFDRFTIRSKDSSRVTALAPASTKPDNENETASWWLWISWLEREGHSNFVFGCAARTFHAAGWTDDATFEILGGGRLTVHQCTVTEEVFGLLKLFRHRSNSSPQEDKATPIIWFQREGGTRNIMD
jgi:hypothetical protein